ncbi:hypothetical protein WJX73_004710 [Symbiochloris irregularis]|uniref:Uncharacterized protein n=1 Tax=Symbiochloris irregularis TaxID=706552 RepID=A0AAW1NW77_9CHLO
MNFAFAQLQQKFCDVHRAFRPTNYRCAVDTVEFCEPWIGSILLNSAHQLRHGLANQKSLALYLYDDARFWAERLVAQFPKEGNVLLQATCYFRSDQAYRAYHLLLGKCTEHSSRYLLAQCCLALGKLSEAEEALIGPMLPRGVALSPEAPIPGGAAGLYLLARICRMTDRIPHAVQYLCRALSQDPFLWCAFEELCHLGADQEAVSMTKAALATAASAAAAASSPEAPAAAAESGPATNGPATSQAADASGPDGASPNTPAMPSSLPFAGADTAAQCRLADRMQMEEADVGPADSSRGAKAWNRRGWAGASANDVPHSWTSAAPGMMSTLPPSSAARPPSQQQHWYQAGMPGDNFTTPSPMGAVPRAAPSMAPPPVAPPPHRLRNAPALDPDQQHPSLGHQPIRYPPAGAGPTPPGGGALDTPHASQRWKFLDDAKLRKVSGRLFSAEPSLRRSSKVAPSPMEASPEGRGGLGSPGDLHGSSEAAYSGLQMGVRTQMGQAGVLLLLANLQEGYRLLCMYCCQEAMLAFKRLSHAQYATGWVLCCIGRAYFEMVDYPQAALAFEWAQQVDPYRLEGMEVYSTVLWHLKREVDLSHNAQKAIQLDRRSPHAWVIVGNCFSLQKEHEAALKAFQRALHLAPNFTYAVTLAGHEYFSSEDLEKSMHCYRAAIRLDRRHYNAWYGLGQICYRQEKYQDAESHFRQSLDINERSSVLRCYLGMALAKCGLVGEALDMLQMATVADVKNPLARFERARVLMNLERDEEALAELSALQVQAPREASVWFQMGRCLKRLGRIGQALSAFNTALDLQPSSSDAALIKNALAKLPMADDSAEEEM